MCRSLSSASGQKRCHLGAATTLAKKLVIDWFELDGVPIDLDADGNDLSVLNAELAAEYHLNGRHPQIVDSGGVQELVLVSFGTVVVVR